MCMLCLTPKIQQRVLLMPDTVRRPVISERALRPISQLSEERVVPRTIKQESRMPDFGSLPSS